MAEYPLATSYFGVEHLAILDHLVLNTALDVPGLAAGPVLLDVRLEPEALSKSWRVRSDFGIIGYLDTAEAAEFPGLERIKASGLIASTQATLDIVDNALEVGVNLGLWPWQVPHNDQPQGSTLLSGGTGHIVDITVGDLSPNQLERMGAEQLIVTLDAVDGNLLATAEGYVIGLIAGNKTVQEVTALVQAAESTSRFFVARAYCAEGIIAVDLPAGQGDPFDSPLPALQVPPEHAAIPAREDLTRSEVWEVTLPSESFSAGLPRGSRRPSRAQASPDLAQLVSTMPKQDSLSWRALPTADAPGRFSSESARVRARRQARERAAGRGGHHRR